jgi:hypothetical protein
MGHCEECRAEAISERPDDVRHEIATSVLLLARTCRCDVVAPGMGVLRSARTDLTRHIYDHSSRAPESFTTVSYLSYSVFMSFANSSGVMYMGSSA